MTSAAFGAPVGRIILIVVSRTLIALLLAPTSLPRLRIVVTGQTLLASAGEIPVFDLPGPEVKSPAFRALNCGNTKSPFNSGGRPTNKW